MRKVKSYSGSKISIDGEERSLLADLYTLLLDDPKRHAADTIKAYDYQVWQSLFAWINLQPMEFLYLEGAEDIDAYSPNEVTVTQVKHSGQKITLRSKDIIDAINNFWNLKTKNPGQRIKFCFLTLAEPTKEKGSPFGAKFGLDFWTECKDVTVDPMRLKKFLLAQNELSRELKEALKPWTAEEFRRELLLPISWATGSPSFEQTQQQVIEAIIQHGKKQNLNSDQSRKTIPELLEEVRAVIRRKAGRYLEKQEFDDAFRRAARITIPLAGFNALMEMWGRELATGEIEAGVNLEIGSPPLPEPLISRHTLIHQLTHDLVGNRILVITGSSGVGKTIAANQLTVDQGWAWLNLRNTSPTKISGLLKHSLNRFDFGRSVLGVVLDDLDCRQGITEIEPNLIRFLDTLLSCECRIIVTTTTNLPSRIQMLFQDRGILSQDVPYLQEGEIRDFLSRCGLEEPDQLDSWTRIIGLRSQGHPGIVHAWTLKLKNRGWPIPTDKDLLDSDDLNALRKDARTRLLDTIYDDDQKAFIYRISVLRQPFRKDQAMQLAGKELGQPPSRVIYPGEAFDALVGPWIEPVARPYFRISPLLEGTAENVFAVTDQLQLCQNAAEALLTTDPVTYHEITNAALLSWRAQTKEPLKSIVGFLLGNANTDLWPRIRTDFAWLTALATKPGDVLFQADIEISQILRVLQYRIAVEQSMDELAIKIRRAWQEEIGQISDPSLRKRMRLIYITQAIMRTEVSLDMKTVVDLLMEAITLTSSGAYEAESKGDDLFQDNVLIRGLLLFMGLRVSAYLA